MTDDRAMDIGALYEQAFRDQRRPGAAGGFWPSSPEISRAMLERYGKAKK